MPRQLRQVHLYAFVFCLVLSFQCLVLSFSISKYQIKGLNKYASDVDNFQTRTSTIKSSPALIKTHSSSSSFRLQAGFFWEDDLPNLFGINPIEASIIFGILYYLYGPDELYGYAREAGKLFSIYVPVVRDLAVLIYNEFKEYIDEDKERDEMMKRGIDVSKFPRRTTNLIERVQESIDMLSEMTKASSTGRDNTFGDDVQIGLTPELFKNAEKLENDEETNTKTKKRKTKKKILEAKNIDVSKLIEFENANTSQKPDAQVEAELSKSINLVQERFATMTGSSNKNNINSNNNNALQDIDASQFGSMLPPPSASMMNSMGDGINEDEDYFFPGARAPPLSSSSSFTSSPSFAQSQQQTQAKPPSTEGMTRFQQQMSGMWNQKVLERESVTRAGSSAAGGTAAASDWGSTDWEDPLALTSGSGSANSNDNIYSNSISNNSNVGTTNTFDNQIDQQQQQAVVTEPSSLYNDFGMPMDLDSFQAPQPAQISYSVPSSLPSSTSGSDSSSITTINADENASSFYPYLSASENTPTYNISIGSDNNTNSDINRYDLINGNSGTVNNNDAVVTSNDEVSQVLAELDRDYQALRRKLVNAILTVERKASSSSVSLSSPQQQHIISPSATAIISDNVSNHAFDLITNKSTSLTKNESLLSSTTTPHSSTSLLIQSLSATPLTADITLNVINNMDENIAVTKQVYWPPGIWSRPSSSSSSSYLE